MGKTKDSGDPANVVAVLLVVARWPNRKETYEPTLWTLIWTFSQHGQSSDRNQILFSTLNLHLLLLFDISHHQPLLGVSRPRSERAVFVKNRGRTVGSFPSLVSLCLAGDDSDAFLSPERKDGVYYDEDAADRQTGFRPRETSRLSQTQTLKPTEEAAAAAANGTQSGTWRSRQRRLNATKYNKQRKYAINDTNW